jgi:hypothetical protein
MMIHLVSPHCVRLDETPHARDVAAQKRRLETEGQIEPVLVRRGMVPVLDNWFYAPAQVVAARELGWETILVTCRNDAGRHVRSRLLFREECKTGSHECTGTLCDCGCHAVTS